MMISPSAIAATDVASSANPSRSFVFIVMSKRLRGRNDVIAT
jgi:hypothetical protein